MKIFTKLLFIGTFIFFFVLVGNAVVNSIISLFPESASEWFPLIRFLLWIFTFSFDLVVTVILYFLFVYLVSVLARLFD